MNDIYYCECVGSHEPGCLFYKRLMIKEQLCEKYKIEAHIVPEWLEKEVDKIMRESKG